MMTLWNSPLIQTVSHSEVKPADEQLALLIRTIYFERIFASNDC